MNEQNTVKIEQQIKEVEQKLDAHSLAWECLAILKKQNKRMFLALMAVVFMWFATIAVLIGK
jgi:hypothetical protein